MRMFHYAFHALCCCTVGALLLSTAAKAQNTEIASEGLICGYLSLPRYKNAKSMSKPSPEAIKAVNWIADKIGIAKNFQVLKAEFTKSPLAFASIRGGERFIVYDQDLFSAKNGQISWQDVAVFGHEVGHHILGHTAGSNKSPHDRELEADRFAGFAVSRLGGSLEDALMITRYFSAEGSKSHPPQRERIEAITNGWHHGEKMKSDEQGQCKIQWLGEEFEKDGVQCQYALGCSGKGPALKSACRSDSGDWFWIK